MIEHTQICDACGERSTFVIETFEQLDGFVKTMMTRLNETKARGEFEPKEKLAGICQVCWETRKGHH
jgi:hypothetical protein